MAKGRKSKSSIDSKWVQAPLAELPPEPESGPPDWQVRCGDRPAWLNLGATLRFPELGDHLVAGIRPGARTWEAMPRVTSRWFEVDLLDLVAPSPKDHRPWPGTNIHLKL
jgi:hypothetical protein